MHLSDSTSSNRAWCVINDVKTGEDQFVPLSDLHLLSMLQYFHRFRSHLEPWELFLDMSYENLVSCLHRSLEFLVWVTVDTPRWLAGALLHYVIQKVLWMA